MHFCMDVVMTSEDHLDTDWPLIRSFIAVMRAGTLTGAARLTGATQPTLGRHIRKLETRSGDVLFIRQAGRMTPTDRARELFRWAQALEQDVAALGRAFALPTLEMPGTVRITTSHIFAVHVLPDLLGPLLSANAGLEVEVFANDSLDNLVRRDADIAIRFVRPEQPELVARKVGDIAIGLYATRQYLDKAGRPQGMRDLAGHAFATSLTGDEFRAVARSLGADAEGPQLRVRSDSLLVQNAAVRAGLGIGALQQWLAARDLDLEPVLPQLSLPKLPLWLAAHNDLNRSRRLRVVFDALHAGLSARFRT